MIEEFGQGVLPFRWPNTWWYFKILVKKFIQIRKLEKSRISSIWFFMLFTENRAWEVSLEKRDSAGIVGFWEVTCWAVKNVKEEEEEDEDESVIGFFDTIKTWENSGLSLYN